MVEINNIPVLFINLRSNHIRKFLQTKKRTRDDKDKLSFLEDCFDEYFSIPTNQWLVRIIEDTELYSGGRYLGLISKFYNDI